MHVPIQGKRIKHSRLFMFGETHFFDAICSRHLMRFNLNILDPIRGAKLFAEFAAMHRPAAA